MIAFDPVSSQNVVVLPCDVKLAFKGCVTIVKNNGEKSITLRSILKPMQNELDETSFKKIDLNDHKLTS